MSVVPLLVPHALCLLVGGVIVAFAIRHHRAQGILAFALGVVGQMIWTAGYLFEVLATSLEDKIFWDNFQLLGTIGWVVGFFRFAVHYTHRGRRWMPGVTALSMFLCGGYLALAATDQLHGLIRPHAELVRDGDFVALVYPFTAATYLVGGYSLFMLGACVWLLFQHSWRVSDPYRAQSRLVAIGTLVPLLGLLATLGGLVPAAYRDISPITFAVGDSLIAWGLFRHRFLELVPVARDIVFENLRDNVVVVDALHRVVDVNAGVLVALNKPRDAVIGELDTDVFAEWGELVQRLRTAEEGTIQASVSVAGNRLQIEIQVTSLRDRRGRLLGRVLSAHDITEFKRVQGELEQKNSELKRAFEELDAFSYSVSHDLRAPLRAVSGFSKRLIDTQSAALDDEGRELLQRTQHAAKRMQQLIDDLLGFARLGRRAVSKQPVQTAELVREVIADLRGECDGRSVEFVVGELPNCVADPALLRQVYVNLIGNAVKYTRPREQARIEVGASSSQPVTYFVKDNGVGFDMQYAERLFGVFQRLHGEKEFEGTGIGLATAKQIILRHGGAIRAEAILDQGATFSFTLGPGAVKE
jgi:signal transduction histidine kinase